MKTGFYIKIDKKCPENVSQYKSDNVVTKSEWTSGTSS